MWKLYYTLTVIELLLHVTHSWRLLNCHFNGSGFRCAHKRTFTAARFHGDLVIDILFYVPIIAFKWKFKESLPSLRNNRLLLRRWGFIRGANVFSIGYKIYCIRENKFSTWIRIIKSSTFFCFSQFLLDSIYHSCVITKKLSKTVEKNEINKLYFNWDWS